MHKTESRTQAQRERILAAARTCFVKSGFHAASMATIADTAGMSPGLIYRYFQNKNAIILAIIEEQLEAARIRIGQLHPSIDLAASIAGSFNEPCEKDRSSLNAALFLEMSAEATRDPEIGAALQAFDTTVRADIAGWLGGRHEENYGLPRSVTPARALLLQCLIEGLKVREAREPELDRDLLKAALDDVLPTLLQPPA